MGQQGQIFGAPQIAGESPLASANIFVGNSSGIAAAVSPSGDVTISNTGATAIGANRVTNSQLATMATTTIKGQTVGGSGSPVDLTAAQAAAIIGSVGGAIKSKIITITRDLTVASGSVAYTGVGFQPTILLAAGEVTNSLTGYVTIFGASDSSLSAFNAAVAASTISVGAGFLSYIDPTFSNYQLASIVSYDSDGFTLSWTKNGIPTGTATTRVLCLK